MTTEDAVKDRTAETAKQVTDLMDIAAGITLARAHMLHITAFGMLSEDQEHWFAEGLRELDQAETLAWAMIERQPGAPKRPR